MLFCYYDLFMVMFIFDDEKSEYLDYDYSINSIIIFVGNISVFRVERSYDRIILNDIIIDDLISNGVVFDGEKQKFVNINVVGFYRRQRKVFVIDKWYLVRGR